MLVILNLMCDANQIINTHIDYLGTNIEAGVSELRHR